MMKIVASLIILGLCASVSATTYYAPANANSNAGAIATSNLNNSFVTKVFSAANSTDAKLWDSSTATGTGGTPAGSSAGVSMAVFGPGSDNGTSYVYGVTLATTNTAPSTQSIATIVKRAINNTIVLWGNDTVEACVESADSAITAAVDISSGAAHAVAPGYLAVLAAGTDGTNNQVWVGLLGSSWSKSALTKTLDIVTATTSTTIPCTKTTAGTGNIWFDIGAQAFFYTYWVRVNTYAASTGNVGSGTCGSSSTGNTVVNSIYLGGIYLNGTAYWSADLKIAPSTPANSLSGSGLMGGGDNWLNSSNLYVVYKDGSAAVPTTYVSKTAKASTTTAGSFGTLIADAGQSWTTSPAITYFPLAVWASNNTYGIAVSNQTATWTGTYGQNTVVTYTNPITNFLNGTTTGTDSGLSSSSATTSGTTALALYGWPLNTGYTLVGEWPNTSGNTNIYQIGTFYANGTVNSTQTTLASSFNSGSINFYEDLNGTVWVGWNDEDSATGNPWVYAGYLAPLQGQINVGANVLATLSAFCVLFLASIFAF